MKKQEERFIKKEYSWDWWFIFDKKQEYTEDTNKIPFPDVDNLIAMSEDQVTDLLNKLYKENREYQKCISHYADITACSVQLLDQEKELVDEYTRIIINDSYELLQENQELRKDNNRLVKKTAEVIAEHQGQILTIIDEALDKVKQDTKKNYSRYDVIQILTHIKKEQNER